LIKLTFKPILSSAALALAVWISFGLLKTVVSQNLSTLLSIAFGGLIYVLCLFITGAITEEDLDLIPKGEKLKKFVRKK